MYFTENIIDSVTINRHQAQPTHTDSSMLCCIFHVKCKIYFKIRSIISSQDLRCHYHIRVITVM